MKGRKILILVLGILAGSLLCIYLAVSVYFMSHFYYGTEINGINFSMKTIKEAEGYFEEQVGEYVMTIRTKEGQEENIAGKELSMRYKKSGELKEALEKQNAFLWPSMFGKENNITIKTGVDIDEALLNQKIEALDCYKNEGKTDPENAKPEFDGDRFVVRPEVLGTKVNQEQMKAKVKEKVQNLQADLDLEDEGCYQRPAFTSESSEVKAACDVMNQYCNANITYDMPPQKDVVDKSLISTWLSCDENMNVVFQEDMVRAYMAEFAAKYESLNKTRTLTTPAGKVAEVSGGTYGWAIDEATEAEALIASIKAGETVTKEPVYEQRAAVHGEQDWGTTYIEVDLSAQYMWYISEGNVMLETPVVTGKPYEHSTPAGVYDILLMSLDTTLVGNIVPETGKPEYRTPVSYWMQVTWGGVGFHDATWQPAFGGDLYWSIGSHGCINMPLDMAGSLYSMISADTPVVMHY